MGFPIEIRLYQNPNYKKSQVELLYKSLIRDEFHPFDQNGYVQFKSNNEEVVSLPADDVGIHEQEEAIRIAEVKNTPITIQFTHKLNQRSVTLIQNENEYKFLLEIRLSDNKYQLLNQFHKSIHKSIPNTFHKNKINWFNNSNEEIIRCETDMYHEGVLILCSSNRLKDFFETNEFSYDYPKGLSELLRQNIIIAIDSKDYEYSTILEKVKITDWRFGYYNSINFTDDDKLLILHHGDFAMICNNYRGDYKSYGWKHILVLPIEHKKDQVMLIAKPNDEADRRIIIQFANIDNKLKKNNLIEYEEIPTHSKA